MCSILYSKSKHSPRITNSIAHTETTSSEVDIIIDDMDLNKSTREDDIPIKIFKMSKPIISNYLAQNFTRMNVPTTDL